MRIFETYEITNKVQFFRALLNPMDTTRIGNEFVHNVNRIERVHGEDNLFRISCCRVSDGISVTLLVEVLDN